MRRCGCVRPRRCGPSRPSKVATSGWRDCHGSGGGCRLAGGWCLRNVIRNRLRSGVGLFAATMGTALLITGLTLQYCTRYLIDFQFDKVMCSDVDLSFKDERGYDALYEARRLPGVDHAEPVFDVACDFFNGQFHRKGGITGLAPGARLTQPRDLSGRKIRVPESGPGDDAERWRSC